MRILVYPHSMEIGGSQTNAVELAAAVRDLGHEVVVYSDDGPMVDRVAELDLEHIRRRPSRYRPGIRTALDLRRIVRQRSLDVVHGYEWPTIFEADAATSGTRAEAVGTIMSMSVAPFVPSSVPIVVGTAAIQAEASRRRTGEVHLIEPPVDTEGNNPSVVFDEPTGLGLDSEATRVVIVSRLASELKLEGILTSIAACDRLAAHHLVQLVVVGDGPARSVVVEHASAVNTRHGREVVVIAGEWSDPRWAYGSADMCVAMGGSALRAAAFAKPLIVQGEGGFFELLDDSTVSLFLQQGWYGVRNISAEDSATRLAGQLAELVVDEDRRLRLGTFAREVVESRFSLTAAATVQERIYEAALASPRGAAPQLSGTARSSGQLIAYKVGRRWERVIGRSAVDDFNARPVVGVSGS